MQQASHGPEAVRFESAPWVGTGEQRPPPDFDMRPDLLALYSPISGAGKSEIAKVLMNERRFKLVKFAGAIKDMTRAKLTHMGFDAAIAERMVEGDLKEKPIPGLGGLTPRRVMQTLGTEWGRQTIQEDLWVRIAMTKVRDLMSRGWNVVIDDMRFPNEFDAVVDAGGCASRLSARPPPIMPPVTSPRVCSTNATAGSMPFSPTMGR